MGREGGWSPSLEEKTKTGEDGWSPSPEEMTYGEKKKTKKREDGRQKKMRKNGIHGSQSKTRED